MHFVLLGDRFNHEVGTVADVGERAEQDCAHGNGGQFGVAAGSELLHRVGVFNAEAAATESISEKSEIGRGVVENGRQSSGDPVELCRSVDRQFARMKLHVVEHWHHGEKDSEKEPADFSQRSK